MKDLFGEIDEECMYRIAINQPLDYKIEQAIGLIRMYENQALQLSPDGYYVCDSFGKDSGVILELFKMSGVKFKAHYNVVTLDPPELVLFGRKHHPETVWEHKRVGNLPMYMRNKTNGPPTRLSRWCCEIYKEQGGAGCLKATGVRAEESARRRGLWKQININRNDGSPIMCPIIYWTETDVWNFTRERDIPYCSLYDEGYRRLGCVGCPMSGQKGMARDFARWPKYYAMWRRGFQAYWNTWKGVPTKKPKVCPQCHGTGAITFEEDDMELTITCLKCNGSGESHDRWIEKMQTVDDLWNWWVSGKAYEGEGADCQLYLW